MLVRRLITLSFVLLLSSCSSTISQQSMTLSTGEVVDYIYGKVSGDGQESNFRDAWLNGKPVLSNYLGGQSLTGQIMGGAAQSALYGVGLGVPAALGAWQTHIKESTNLNNSQGQAQGQQQGQAALSSSTASSDSTSTAINANSNNNSNHNSNRSRSTAIGVGVGQGGQGGQGGSGGSGGGACQHHCGSEQGPGDNN